MLVVALIAQFIVIIWLLVLMSMSTNSLKKRIDRASRHLEMTEKPEDPKPICGCSHHACFHDESGCSDVGQEYQSCGCKRYTGPETLPTVIP